MENVLKKKNSNQKLKKTTTNKQTKNKTKTKPNKTKQKKNKLDKLLTPTIMIRLNKQTWYEKNIYVSEFPGVSSSFPAANVS